MFKRSEARISFRRMCAEHSSEVASLSSLAGPARETKQAELTERWTYLKGYAEALETAGVMRKGLFDYKFPPLEQNLRT